MRPVSLFALSEAMADWQICLERRRLGEEADWHDSLGEEADWNDSFGEEALDHPPMASSSTREEAPIPLPFDEPESSGSGRSKRWKRLTLVSPPESSGTPPESSGSPCRPPRSRYYRFLIHSKKPKQKKPKQQKGKQKNSHPPYRYW